MPDGVARAAPSTSSCSRPSAGRRRGSRPSRACAPGGTVVLVGGCPAGTDVALPAGPLHYDELTLTGAFHHTRDDVDEALRAARRRGPSTPRRLPREPDRPGQPRGSARRVRLRARPARSWSIRPFRTRMRLSPAAALARGARRARPALAAPAPGRGTAFVPTPRDARTSTRSRRPTPTPTPAPRRRGGRRRRALHRDLAAGAQGRARRRRRRVPVVVVHDAVRRRRAPSRNQELIDALVPRGYAVMQAHVRGHRRVRRLPRADRREADRRRRARHRVRRARRAVLRRQRRDVRQVLRRRDPALDGRPRRPGQRRSTSRRSIPVASVGGQYEYSFFDGVPYAGQALLSNGAYLGTTSLMPGRDDHAGADRREADLPARDLRSAPPTRAAT